MRTRKANNAIKKNRRLVVAGALTAFCLFLITANALRWFKPPDVQPPAIHSEGVDPAIVRAIRTATSKTIQSPKSADAWGQLGMVLLAHEFTAEASIAFGQAARLDPQNPAWPYLNGRGTIQTDPSAARTLLEQAVAICGNTPEAPRQRLIELLMEQQDLSEARRHLDEFLAVHPSSARARQNLARLAYLQNDPQKCYHVTMELRNELEQHYSAQTRQAEELMRLGRVEESRALMQLAEESRQANRGTEQSSGLLLAEALLKLNRPLEAEAERKRALKLQDELWPDPYWDKLSAFATGASNMLAHADILFGTGKLEASERLLTDVIRQYPESLFARIYMGRGLVRKGRSAEQGGQVDAARQAYRQAEEHLQKALRIDSHSVEAMFRLGVAQVYLGSLDRDNGKLESGIAQLREAVKGKPDFTMAHFNLAMVLYQQRDIPGAIASLEKVIVLEPESVDYQLKMAELYLLDNKLEQAKRHAMAAAELAPDDSRIRLLMQKIEGR